MMTAKVRTEVVSITCPNCDEVAKFAHNGSYDLSGSDIPMAGSTFKCERCGITMRMPAAAKFQNN